jgi:hypothetical protein
MGHGAVGPGAVHVGGAQVERAVRVPGDREAENEIPQVAELGDDRGCLWSSRRCP